jgi:phage terminase large subunit-like protein
MYTQEIHARKKSISFCHFGDTILQVCIKKDFLKLLTTLSIVQKSSKSIELNNKNTALYRYNNTTTVATTTTPPTATTVVATAPPATTTSTADRTIKFS